MSTRCRIGIENKDGTITSIYCHHDGYVDGGVGETLVNHYRDEKTIRKLMELGDISSLGTKPIDNPSANEDTSQYVMNPKEWSKIWNELHPDDMCDTYRSCGEDCPASVDNGIEEYIKRTDDCWGDYCYIFRDGEWYVNGCGEDDEFTKVSELMK